jgi:two-component system sensor histidine kinase/response regulator
MSGERFKILLVEDNPGDARLIRESLAETTGDPFDLEIADRLAPALRRLSDGGIDALLLDLGLPDSKGQETFNQAKAHAPTVPIIVLTGLGDEAVALKMVQDGAQDYIAKIDVNGSILSRVIRYAIAREHSDQQIRKFNEELEQRVRARTAELEAANKELEAFSYSVSHDLRAPLRHIDGFSRILLESCGPQLGAEGEKYLQRICTATQHMANLIDDLLKLAQVGRQVLNLRPTRLDALVGQILEEFGREIQGRQIEWKIQALPSATCDEGLTKQVFSNLIGNSIKYTRPRHTAVIEIGQTLIAGTPAFFVRDNGAGFDMKYAGKLFGAFQRLHAEAEFEGTGIGLATVQRIVQRHGGAIWAEAQPDKGATFYFTLEPAAHAFLVRRG